MPVTAGDFLDTEGLGPSATSSRFDDERPFLFEGLEPRYATRRIRSQFVPMRDGVRLSTDLYVPLGAELPLPVVLVRTPYDKNRPATAMPALLPEQGIVYAIQDVRGRYESEGKFVACSAADRTDGHDTVEWLARQPWCNGRVGTLGSSYTGETAAKTAAMRHPAHKCCVVMFDGSYAGGNSLNGAFLQGGVTLFRMLATWFRDWVPKISFGPPPHVDREAWYQSPWADAYATQPVRQPVIGDAELMTLPVCDVLDRAGAAPSEFADMMRRAADPAARYWHEQGFLTDADQFDTPSIFLTGPLERGGSSFDNFRLLKANGTTAEVRDRQYLWFTPAAHSGYAACGEHSRSGIRDFGDTRFPYYRKLVGWFAHWLRGDPLDLDAWSKVSYFIANRNSWAQASDWPPPNAVAQRWFLRKGDALTPEKPAALEAADAFDYDPSFPTPSEPPGTSLDTLGGGYADRAMIDVRADVLTYTSAPREAPLTLTGPVRAELHVSSTALDTDFVAVLTEVDAAGRSINITHGIARMRFRNGVERAEMMEPGTIYPVTIDLWHVAIEIPAGHCLRLAISSCHFPVHERNLNTGGDNFTGTEWQVATNRVHHDSAHASALILPVCA